METAFQSGAPFLLSDQCGAVTVFLSSPFQSFLSEAYLGPPEGMWVIASFWFYALVDYAAFHQTANIYKWDPTLVLSVLSLPL